VLLGSSIRLISAYMSPLRPVSEPRTNYRRRGRRCTSTDGSSSRDSTPSDALADDEGENTAADGEYANRILLS
jgi:hypothetical protein